MREIFLYQRFYSLIPVLFQRSIFQLLQGAAKLIRTTGTFRTTTDAVEFAYHIVDMLSSDQQTDTLQVAVATAKEENLLDDVMFIGCHVDHLRAGALSHVLYMLRCHLTQQFPLVSCLYKPSGHHRSPPVSLPSYQWSHAAQQSLLSDRWGYG